MPQNTTLEHQTKSSSSKHLLNLQLRIASRQNLSVSNFTDFATAAAVLDLSAHLFTALHGMQTLSYDENSVRSSVRPFVCPSVKRVHCDKTEERYV